MRVNDVTRELDGIRNDQIFYAKFKSGGSSSLAVDGSVTPVVFTLEDIPYENFILLQIDYVLSVGDVLDITKFANLVALTNGLLFNFDGAVPFKNNADLLLFAGKSSIDSVKITGVVTTILNGAWNVKEIFDNGLISSKSNLSITVQDAMQTIPYMEFSAYGIKLD